MTNPEIRLIPEEERGAVIMPMLAYAFNSSPPLRTYDSDPGIAAFFASRAHDDYYALYADGEPVASVLNSTGTHNIQQNIVKTSMVWGVTAYPEVRRRGYVRQIMMRMFNDARASGVPASALYAFRESFYERMGYVSYPPALKVTMKTTALLPLQKWHMPGTVTRHLSNEMVPEIIDFLKTIQAGQHGMALFGDDAYQWAFTTHPKWIACARVDDEVVGMMVYHVEPHGHPFTVEHLLYTNEAGRILLLEWIARHVDQTGDVIFEKVPSGVHATTWLADTLPTVELLEAPMIRILDVTALSGLASGPGTVTIYLDDPIVDGHSGTYRLASVDGKLQVTEADDDADCQLTAQGLTAWLYGIRDPGEFSIRGWGNPSHDVQATMRAMFPPAHPYMFAKF